MTFTEQNLCVVFFGASAAPIFGYLLFVLLFPTEESKHDRQ